MLPPGASVLLPNLRDLILNRCALTPAARATVLDAACCRLHLVSIQGLSADAQQQPNNSSLQQLATAQLRQLAKLPSLSRVDLVDASCPTLFLVALGTQLTGLHVDHSYQQCEPGTQTPVPGWRATLQHVARCTRLQVLSMPCRTVGELALAAPALQQLRTLRLTSLRAVEADGDAVVEVLLGLPHLTSLYWSNCGASSMQRWYNARACQWEQLTTTSITPQQLARLPLHSLKQPYEWTSLQVPPSTLVHEARAAAANVMQRCPRRVPVGWD